MQAESERLMNAAEVSALVRRSKTSIYAAMKANAFPRPVKIGFGSGRNSAVAWRERDVREWLRTRPVAA